MTLQHRITYIILCSTVLLFLCVSSAFAAVVRSDDRVVVSETDVVPGNFYAYGTDIYLSGVIEGDVYALSLGGTVTITGVVKGDVVVFGGIVTIDGEVDGDVRVVGGKVTLSKDTKGEGVIIAGSLMVLPSAHVHGDMYFFGEDADIQGGTFDGAFTATLGSLKVNALTSSLDVVATRELYLGPQAQIKGDVTYKSAQEVVRAPESVVEGKIYRQDMDAPKDTSVRTFLPLWFMTLFSSLGILLVFREVFVRMLAGRGRTVGISGVIGLGTLVAVPTAVVVLCVTVVGVPIGVVLLCAYLCGVLLASLSVPILVGAYSAYFAGKGFQVTWLWTVIGVVICNGILFIPVVGAGALVVMLVITLGMMVSYGYHAFRASFG